MKWEDLDFLISSVKGLLLNKMWPWHNNRQSMETNRKPENRS